MIDARPSLRGRAVWSVGLALLTLATVATAVAWRQMVTRRGAATTADAFRPASDATDGARMAAARADGLRSAAERFVEDVTGGKPPTERRAGGPPAFPRRLRQPAPSPQTLVASLGPPDVTGHRGPATDSLVAYWGTGGGVTSRYAVRADFRYERAAAGMLVRDPDGSSWVSGRELVLEAVFTAGRLVALSIHVPDGHELVATDVRAWAWERQTVEWASDK